jgi:hypothetical protein
MADDTTTVQGTTDTTAESAVQPVPSLLNTPQADDAATDNAPADADAATPATTDTATDTDKPEGEQSAEEATPVTPEKYEFTAPEGVTLDADAVAEFEPIAKELNLSNDQAQKLVELQTKFVQKQHAAWETQVQTWVAEVNADKEIGGKALAENVKHAQRAIGQFGTPELKAALDATKMGNHPELVRVFARIGKAMADDTFVPSGSPAGTKRDAAEIMFGKS